jgi:opacity protein-like surface antigen
MKKALLLVVLASWVCGLGFAQAQPQPGSKLESDAWKKAWYSSNQLTLYGGINRVFHYTLDTSLFPSVPAHTKFNIGGSLLTYLTERIGIEFDLRYHFRTRITYNEGGDELYYKTVNHYNVAANALYFFALGRFRPYLKAGLGIDRITTPTETYTTKLGRSYTFHKPDPATQPGLTLGLGFFYAINRTLGIRSEARFLDIKMRPSEDVPILTFTLGAFINL